jgi:hypothetical protein
MKNTPEDGEVIPKQMKISPALLQLKTEMKGKVSNPAPLSQQQEKFPALIPAFQSAQDHPL